MKKKIYKRSVNTECSVISVEERIAKYNTTIENIKSSSRKTNDYLVSTGIYTSTGKLNKVYR